MVGRRRCVFFATFFFVIFDLSTLIQIIAHKKHPTVCVYIFRCEQVFHIHTIGFVSFKGERKTFASYVSSVQSRESNATHERKIECLGVTDFQQFEIH